MSPCLDGAGVKNSPLPSLGNLFDNFPVPGVNQSWGRWGQISLVWADNAVWVAVDRTKTGADIFTHDCHSK